MKKIILFAAALICTSVITTIVYHKTQKADIRYYHGHRYFEKNNYDQAIAWHERALKIDPGHENVLREVAYAYQWTGQYEKAINNFQKVLFLYPDDNKIKKSLAETYSWQKEYEKAIPLYKEVIDATGDIEAKKQLAGVYVWNKNYEDAVKQYKKILKDESDNIKIKVALADILSWQKKYGEAIFLYKNIIIATGDINIKRQLAEIYVWNKQFDKAKDILETITESDSEDFEAKLLLAKALHYSGNINKARLIYEELIKEKRLGDRAEELEARKLLGTAYMADKNYEDSIRQYREVLKEEPDNIKIRTSMADILSWQKKYKEAISEYKKILEFKPDNLEIKEKLAKVYLWKRDYRKAENLYKDILKNDPQNLEAYVAIGQILAWQEKYSEAIYYFKLALSHKEEKDIKLLYGQALLYSGDYERAKEIFRELISSDTDNIEAKVYLADIFSYNKEFANAISLYKEVLQKENIREVKRKLADVLSWDKKYSEAIALYDELLIEKEESKIRLQKARLLGWWRKYNEALKEYQKILDRDYAPLVELEMKAKKAYWNNRVKHAIRYCRELIAKDPENVEAMFDLSQVYSYQSMWEEAIVEYKRILDISPDHFRAKEGLQKVEFISIHPSLKSGYEFFEADSLDRVNDIDRHSFFNKITIPVDYNFKIEAGYKLTSRSFSDFEDVSEHTGRIGVSYIESPDWRANAFYSFFAYNNDVDTIHTFGGDFNFRFFDMGAARFSYERERLENSSTVIRDNYYRDNLKGRLDIDVTKRLKLGLDYLFSDHSDDNSQNEPGFDMLYYLSLEPRRLTVKYRYFYREFDDIVNQYFSPQDFFTHTFILNWRHFLNKEEVFFGADDLYYDMGYDISIDSGDTVGHKFSAGLNWDINKRLNFNVKGSVANTDPNVYKDKAIAASIKYYF